MSHRGLPRRSSLAQLASRRSPDGRPHVHFDDGQDTDGEDVSPSGELREQHGQPGQSPPPNEGSGAPREIAVPQPIRPPQATQPADRSNPFSCGRLDASGGSVSSSECSEAETIVNRSDTSFGSYSHPYEIRPPQPAYGAPPPLPPRGRSPSLHSDVGDACHEVYGDVEQGLGQRADRQRGYLSNLIDLMANEQGQGCEDSEDSRRQLRHSQSFESTYTAPTRPDLRRFDSCVSDDSSYTQVIDPDDPKVTGRRKKELDDPEDIERAVMKQMSYKARRKLRSRIRIEFNITCTPPRSSPLLIFARSRCPQPSSTGKNS